MASLKAMARRSRLLHFVVTSLSHMANNLCLDPFADEGSFQSKQVEPVHIRLQRKRLRFTTTGYLILGYLERNGRKTLTTVQGVHKDFDPKKILKYLKKKYGMSQGLRCCLCSK